MGIEIAWRSEQGNLTSDNRDYCGIGLRDESFLAIVLDGSTSKANSGGFAQAIAQGLIDWFVSSKTVTVETVTNRLLEIHDNLSASYRKASASFAIALVENEGTIWLLHAGDCLAGTNKDLTGTAWQVLPHTLVNVTGGLTVAEIAGTPVRHLLTRSFRSWEFMVPDISELCLKKGQTLVLATDGFWAELTHEEQEQFLAGKTISAAGHRYEDDCSALILRHVAGKRNAFSRGAYENLYIVDATG